MRSKVAYLLLFLLAAALAGCGQAADDSSFAITEADISSQKISGEESVDMKSDSSEERSKKYNVKYSDKFGFSNADDSYTAGEEVTLYYNIIATDTDYSFYIDGESVNVGYSDKEGFILSFTMPDHDINIEVRSHNSMEYIPVPSPVVFVEINGTVFTADMEDNSSADELIEKLSAGEITVDMQDYGGFEKVGDLPWSLSTNDEQITTSAGDIILYQGNKITIYYGENTWEFTKLGKVNATREQLLEAMGDGDISARFFVEWTE